MHRISNRLLALALIVALGSAAVVLSLLQIQRLRAQALVAENARQRIEQLDNTIAMEGANLEGFVRDDSYWDDMVRFIAHPDAGWADDNITQSLPTFAAHAAWIYRMDDSPVYSATDTSPAGQRLAGLAMPEWRVSFGDARFAHFYVNTPAGLTEVRGATVHPYSDPERKGEPAGYLYAARVWTPCYVAMLAHASGAQLSLTPAAGNEQSSDNWDERTGAITLTRALTGSSGAPRAVLLAGYVFSGMRVFNHTSQVMTLLFVAYALLTLGVLFWYLYRWVTRPLQLVTDSLCREDKDSIRRLQRNPTEFGRIGQLMQEFVDQKARLVQEVSQREKAETALRANEERYRTVVENANEAIVVLQDGDIKFANPRASELTGFTLDEFKHMPFLKIVHPDDRQMVAANYQRRLEGERTESAYPLRLIAKGGRMMWAETRGSLINWEGRPASLSFLADITERKRAEAELEKSNGQLAASNEQLVESNRQRRELFDLVVLHDFGTPLTVMQGYIDLLTDGLFGELSEGQRKVIATLAARLKELNSVRDRVMEASGLDSGSITLAPEMVDVQALVKTSIQAIEGYARDRGIELTSSVPEVQARCDPRRMQQAVDNFLLSALKYAGSAQQLEVSASILGPELFLWFRDKGGSARPINPATAESGTDLRFATGIELALARAIIEAHKGRVFVESKSRHAMSIGFSVPLSADPDARPEPKVAREEPAESARTLPNMRQGALAGVGKSEV
jgi:PAS domain S-box-containing protein